VRLLPGVRRGPALEIGPVCRGLEAALALRERQRFRFSAALLGIAGAALKQHQERPRGAPPRCSPVITPEHRELLGELLDRWSLHIIDQLCEGPRGFNDWKRAVPDVSPSR